MKSFFIERGVLLQNGEASNTIHLPFPDYETNIVKKDEYYKKWSYSGCAGSSGDDSCILAYDYLLIGNGDYEKTLVFSALHAGDSDSTAAIAMAWYGAMYGYPPKDFEVNWKQIEYKDRIIKSARKLYSLYESWKVKSEL